MVVRSSAGDLAFVTKSILHFPTASQPCSNIYLIGASVDGNEDMAVVWKRFVLQLRSLTTKIAEHDSHQSTYHCSHAKHMPAIFPSPTANQLPTHLGQSSRPKPRPSVFAQADKNHLGYGKDTDKDATLKTPRSPDRTYDPNRVRLNWPFDGTPYVTLCQSDIGRLNDGEYREWKTWGDGYK